MKDEGRKERKKRKKTKTSRKKQLLTHLEFIYTIGIYTQSVGM